jgi:DNA-binding response OmpR family regulator
MKPKVMAVEDDKGVLALLRTVLLGAGFEVIACTNVAEFRLAKAAHDVDLYLIDVGLPDGNGLHLAKELRQESPVGIILLSGQSSDEDWEAALAIGADDYITKPFRLRDLAERVNKVHRVATHRRKVRDDVPSKAD